MNLQNNAIFIASIITTCLLGAVTYIGWLRRHSRGGMAFFLLMLAATEWTFTYALEALGTTLPVKVFWSKMQYLGIASVSTLWFIFAAQYSEKTRWLTKTTLVLIWIIPAITIGLVMTNELHHFIWSSTVPNEEAAVVVYNHGFWFWVHFAYSYLALLGGTILLVQIALRSWELYRYQSVALLLSAVMPWIGNAIYVAGLVPIPGLDITPFAFAITGLVLTWGLYGFHLFDLVPVARDVLIENMNDGVMVFDERNRIIDANAAAARILKQPASTLLGEPVEKAMAELPAMLAFFLHNHQGETELRLQEDPPHYIDLRVSPLIDRRQNVTGRLVELRDITDRKVAEEDLQEKETRFRTLLENAATGIVIVNSQGQIEFANAGAEEIFGFSISEMLGKPIEMLLPEQFRSSHILQRNRYMDQPAPRKMGKDRELNGHRKDGSEVPLEIGLSYLQTKKDFLITAFILDISERKHNEQALRESEARNRSLVASLAEGIVVQDGNGTIISYNSAAERILGLTSTQTLGKTKVDALWKTIREDGSLFLPDFHPALVTLRTGQRCSNVIMGIQRPNVVVSWVSVNSEPLILPGEKNPIGVVSSYFDITERKRMEEKLVQNEQAERQFSQQLASLQELSVVLQSSVNLDDMCRKAIELGRQRLGFGRLGLWLIDPGDPQYLVGSFGVDENGKIRDEHEQRMEVNKNLAYQYLLTGENRLYYATNHPLRNHRMEEVGKGEIAASGLWDGKQNIGYLVTDNLISGKPITEHQRELLLLYAQTLGYLSTRMRAEQALRESERRYRMLADNAADVIWTLDMQGNFVYASPSVERLLGFTSDELLGKPIYKILAGQSAMDFSKELKQFTDEMKPGQDTGRMLITDIALSRSDGSTAWTEVVSSGLFDEEGKPHGVLGAARDISAKREADQLREDMTHMMVHDLRNPLSSIAVALGALLHGTFGVLDETQGEVLRIAQSSSNKMMQLINDILDINRLEGKKIELEKRAIHLDKLVDELVLSEASLAAQKHITLENQISDSLPMTWIDSSLVSRVLQNLVGNALKFTPEGGNVNISALTERLDDRHVVLVTVRDSGPGIPPEVMKRLFQKFVTGKQQERGSGLGLTFCKLAIEAHGERIWAENCPEKGAMFTFSLPVAEAKTSNE